MVNKLFRKDSKGKIRTLEITTRANLVVQVSGLLEGKKVTTESECLGKNIGRSNETTPEEQAVFEAESKYKKKLNEGYFKTQDEAENELVMLPMLAKDYKKEFKKIDWTNTYVQPKLDGQRILAIKKDGRVKLISRKGKEITTLDHIKTQLESPDIPDNIYDGEAYSLKLGSFQDQMKAIKKYQQDITEQIDFNIYDIIIDKPYLYRYNLLKSIFNV